MDFILDKIIEYDTIIIHRHIRPDGDCVGSQIGLKDIINNSFPNKKVYCVGEETLDLRFLGKMDHLCDETYQNALVFILDVANRERISDDRYNKGKEIIKIDHHPKVQDISPMEWIDTSYSSCCEMIFDFYLKHKTILKMSPEGAKALFYGLITDTNRFLNLAVSSRTFYLASKLLEYNIDKDEIYNHIYGDDLNVTRLRGYVALNFICTPNGLGYIKIDKGMCEKYMVDSSISNILVNTFDQTKLVKIWFVAIYDKKTNRIRISLRSKKLAINHIAEKYGGGGHKHASGIIVSDFNTVDKLIEDLETYLQKNTEEGYDE